MRTHAIRRLWLTVFCMALLAATAAPAQDQGREFHWTGKLAADQIVDVRNLNGVIQAQPASGDQVEITAEKIGPRADEVRIEVVPSSEGVTVCAIYPGMSAAPGSCESAGKGNNQHGDHTRVDFTLRLPANLRFSGENVNGSVIAEDLGRFVRATTVNGKVRVSTRGWAEASSVNGSVEVRMGSADWTGTLKISSVNGSIELEMPSDMNADVRFRSVNGRLESDFPVTVSGKLGGRKMEGRIGNGGRELFVETVNGSVELKRGTI